jgi:hypothetical protein
VLLNARKVDPGGHADQGVGLQPLDCVFESRRGHELLSLVSVVCCQRSPRRTDHSSREVLPSVVCLRRGLHQDTSLASRQRVQSPASERAGSKLAMPITCRNEKAGQSASNTLVHNSTSQRRTEHF